MRSWELRYDVGEAYGTVLLLLTATCNVYIKPAYCTNRQEVSVEQLAQAKSDSNDIRYSGYGSVPFIRLARFVFH